MKRRIVLISGAGTAAAYHMAEVISSLFSSELGLVLCDTNPRHLVASGRFAERFFSVPPINDPEFVPAMLRIMRDESVDYYIPVLDKDVLAFPCDSTELLQLGIRSASPPTRTCSLMASKRLVWEILAGNNVSVPRILTAADLRMEPADSLFFVKPDDGWGSKSAAVVSAAAAGRIIDSEGTKMLVQELCSEPEVTVDVFNWNGVVRSLARQRVETKAGVCTKARIFWDATLNGIAENLCKLIDLPIAFCFQVMKNAMGGWVVTDLNPRIGAGTSMSSAAEWRLVEAFLIALTGLEKKPLDKLMYFAGERFVVRSYRDVRTL